ncbi:MAG: hypothetical protein R3E01_35665 [Pirellulaceae bacterium]|nr:hypothetical protein [Planctomycetales bacterium]
MTMIRSWQLSAATWIAALACACLTTPRLIADDDTSAQGSAQGDSTDLRTDLQISGVYPHLTTYGIYSQNGGHYLDGHNECGIGAIVPWAGRLWMVNYAPHMPRGSEHKLYSIDPDLRELTIHPESVGGTPAGRMIHRESRQLLIAHYLIDDHGKVRVISPRDMPIRVTAIARHLTDPAHMVYYIDMEGSIWEANVHTLAVNRLFKKPVPGWHSKGGYTSQGRLVISNNGELAVGNYADVLVGGAATSPDEAGVLAEWNGEQWRIVERRQYTDVTGPSGITGGSDSNDRLWAIGWDRRSLRLKLLEDGKWHTYLLPKAAYCNDARHGWYTEWPRIREITGGRWMMDMHGMFFDFPPTFSRDNSQGLRPISSHLRYIPDFCVWNDKIVLATDETSIQGNRLAGQPQSNLWFGTVEDLKQWGPASGFGGPWLEDDVQANTPSDPFLVAGFKRRVVHLAVGKSTESTPIQVSLQVDRRGNGTWENLEQVTLSSNNYVAHLLPDDLDAEWLRFTTDRDCTATAFLCQTNARFADGTAEENRELFHGLAEIEDEALGARVYAAKHNRNLCVVEEAGPPLEFTKTQFEFVEVEQDERLAALLEVNPIFGVDEASVKISHRGQTLRLPKGRLEFDRPFEFGWPRDIREVESERVLANIHGTFYEVPLVTNGAPPAFNRMRPVASHSKKIADYCSWNGLLVLSGTKASASADGHVFVNADRSMGLWLGGVDDLWRLGKPTGTGGPWKDTLVESGKPSDPYLMTGYDHKALRLSHSSAEPVTIHVEVDVTGDNQWHRYQSLAVPTGEPLTFQFPDAFQASWVRLVSEQETRATGQLVYD